MEDLCEICGKRKWIVCCTAPIGEASDGQAVYLCSLCYKSELELREEFNDKEKKT